MKLLFEFLPLFLFLIAYKVAGMYMAIKVAMAAVTLQILYYRLVHKRYETMHVISFIIIMVLGSITLFLHNPLIFKWKPTLVFWAFSIAFLASEFVGKKNLLQLMFEKQDILMPTKRWRQLNMVWIGFFTLLGFVNLYVAYHFDTDTWVNFKVFGVMGLSIAFFIFTAFYVDRFSTNKDEAEE